MQLEKARRLVRSCSGAALTTAPLLQALLRHARDLRTPSVPPPTLQFSAGDAVGDHIKSGRPVEQVLFNIALLRRLTYAAASQLGWSTVFNKERLLDNILQIAENGTPVFSSDSHSSQINRFNAALAAGKRAITRDVLHTAIVGLALAIQYRHPTTRALASQAEWRPLLEFVCQQPGYGPFWGSKLAYDLRRVSRARLRPRDRFAFCRWRLAGRVPGLRRITGHTTLEPAVCLRAGGGLVRSNAIWNSITSNGGSANSAKPPNRSGTPSSSLPQRESLGAQPLCSHAAFLVFRHFFYTRVS